MVDKNQADIIVKLITDGVLEGLNELEKAMIENSKQAEKASKETEKYNKQTREASEETKKLSKQTKEASDETRTFKQTLTELNQGAELVIKAFNILRNSFSVVLSGLERGQVVDDISRSFESLQVSVGSNAVNALNKMQIATKGLVSDLDLMKSSNQAVLLGLPIEGFDKAAAAAVKLGQAMGISALSAIESFTTGVGRNSIQMLDNLGIIVKATEANDNYKKTNNILGRELSETEKKLAFQQEAYRKIVETSKLFADRSLNASEALLTVKNEITGLIDESSKQITNNKALAKAFEELREAISDVDIKELVDNLASLATILVKVAKEITRAAIPAIENFSRGLRVLGEIGRSLSKGDYLGALSARDTIAAKESEEATKRIADAYGSLYQADAKIAKDLNKATFTAYTRAVNEYANAVLSTTEATKEDYDQYRIAIRVLADYQEEMTKSIKLEKDQADAIESKRIAQEKANEEAAKAIELEEKRQQAIIDDLNKGIAEADKKIKGSLLGNIGFGDFSFEDSLDPEQLKEQLRIKETFVKLSQDIQSALSQAIGDAFQAIANGANSEDYKQMAQQLGGAIGQAVGTAIGGPIAGQIGAVIGDELFGSVFDVGKAIAKGRSQDIRKSIEESFFGFGREQLAISTAGLSEIFFAFLGGKDAGANARAQVEDWFDGAIDEAKKQGVLLTSFIEDDFSLVAGRDAFDPFINSAGEMTTAVGEKFNTLSADAQATFLGIGSALEQVFQIEGLESGQLGQLLAANFGAGAASLNDLQLLLQSAGVSAEQMGKAVEEAFLNGNLSAGEFLNSQAQINELFTTGIPGAIGDTLTAFNNFREGAKLSGRIAKDAIQDLGAEILEVDGDATLETLRQNLIALQIPIEDVDALFAGFSSAGIGSIQDLIGATTQQTAQITSFAESTGFAFASTEESVKNVREELERIPSRKEIDIVARVRVEAQDGASQDLINAGLLSEGL